MCEQFKCIMASIKEAQPCSQKLK